MEPLTGSDPGRIDGYVLEGRLGAGGYGVVYAATDASGRKVALKVLRPELADNPGLKERLAREGQALGRVGGDRNVDIYEVVTEGSYTYLVMELVEGETLQERIERDGPLAGPILWFTAQGLIEALQAIHDAGITHRDLKPSNVMFGPDGVKVLDFGISAIADETGLTQTGAFSGTAAWIAPEQILGREVTEKCDVFNLGLVVAYAATGRHAYGEGRPDAVMYRISNLDADLEGIDEPLVAAIRRCLERDPAFRPAMSELLGFFTSGGQESLPDLPPDSTIIVQPGQIDRVVKSARGQADSSADPPNIPPSDPPAAPSPPPPSGPKRRWGPRILALAALIVIGGAIGFFVSQNSSSDETSSPATTSLVLTESDSSVQTLDATVASSEAPTVATAAPTTSTYSLATTAAPLDDLYLMPVIEIECHNGDEEGSYEWLEQHFTGTWDWDESIGFGSITLDYGNGKSYTSWSNEDAVENAFWHRYYSPGRFTVRATIADSSGQTATDSCVWVWSLGDDRRVESLGDGSLGRVFVGPGRWIQIRSLNAISGDVAFLGIPNQRGVELAIRDYGPIGGHDVTMSTGLDDRCSADGGQAAAQIIVADESVVGVIGTSCSGAAWGAMPLISEAGMVMISPSNTSPALTSDLAGTAGPNYYPGYYRTAHNDLHQGVAAANFAIDVLGVSTAAAIHDGDPYTWSIADAFADAFEAAGGTITGFTAVNKGDTDMVPVLTEIAAGSPQMLFFPIFQPVGDFIIQQVTQVAGLDNTTMMAADGLLNSNYMALEETEGMYFSGPDIRYGTNFNQSTGQTADAFLAAYNSEWGEDPAAPFWAHSYDATTLLLDAIAAASYDDGGTLVIDRAGVREHLNSVTDYSGIIGLITCDAFGDCGSQKMTVIGHGDSNNISASNANVVYEYALN